VNRDSARIWLARLLIGAVIAWNLQAAVSLLVWPAASAAAFELQGDAGVAAVRGVGVLFIMWNIPYLMACWNPLRNRLSLWEALAMQVVGVLGETAILLALPAGHAVLRGSILHFIGFDAAGVVLLLVAVFLVGFSRKII
jgi:hypothetical protein